MAKKYMITVETNSTFCGIDAGGVQFANGKAIIDECPLIEWFREHEGYSVKAIDEKPAKKSAEKTEKTAEKDAE